MTGTAAALPRSTSAIDPLDSPDNDDPVCMKMLDEYDALIFGDREEAGR